MNPTSPQQPGCHPFREELAARIRRRTFRPTAIAFTFCLIPSAAGFAAGGAFANAAVLGGFVGLDLFVFLLLLWFHRRRWEPVFRQWRGRTASVEGSNLVLRGPGAASVRIRLPDATIHATCGDDGIREIRIFPVNGNGAVLLLALEDMAGLVRQIDAALRASMPDGEPDAPRAAARHH